MNDVRRTPCIGFSISGRIFAKSKLAELRSIVEVASQYGWGVVVPLSHAAERDIARFCNHKGIFCVGLFTGPAHAPEYRGKVVEVDTYTAEQRRKVQRFYEANGKSQSWFAMQHDRQNLMVSMSALVQLSTILTVWPESAETTLVSNIAGEMNHEMYILPHSRGSLLRRVASDPRVPYVGKGR